MDAPPYAHPIAASATGSRTRRVLLLGAIWVLFWLLMVAVAIQDYLRSGGQEWWQPILWETSSALVLTPLIFLQLRYTRRTDRWLARPARWFGAQLVWLPLVCGSFVLLAFCIRHAVYCVTGPV